ncbi:hypothetical protein [Priestia megaterium]|uniref:hypothetical protein n=1 Tax=Priestia megaterium TaxID=1404 RepID=UPI0039E75161
MKFETKYLIRWGIPGWIMIFWVFYQVLFLKGINPLDSKFSDIKNGLTLLISLTALGVPIGYLLHQVYFGVVWVLNKNRHEAVKRNARKVGQNFPRHPQWGNNGDQDYFQFEYVWHSVLLNLDAEKRTYIEGRYRHLLSTIHGLGSLFVSSAISLIVTALIIFTHSSDAPFNSYFWTGFVFQLAIFLSAVCNYGYFSNNLTAFQIKILKTYL